MIIGVYTFELHLPDAGSLKMKRQVVRRLKDRLRSRHNVAVSELEEHQGLWQRAGLAVVSIASHRDALEKVFQAVRQESERTVPGHVIDTGQDFLEAADGGAAGWSEDWP